MLKPLQNRVALGHVTVHMDIQGNEKAAAFAMEATAKIYVDIHIPLQLIYIKHSLKAKEKITEWLLIWKNTDKDKHNII